MTEEAVLKLGLAGSAGLLVLAGLLVTMSRSEKARTLLWQDRPVAGGVLGILSAIGLLVMWPIWFVGSDSGLESCGTFVLRLQTCPGCCASHGLYDERLTVALWILAAGAALLAVVLLSRSTRARPS